MSLVARSRGGTGVERLEIDANGLTFTARAAGPPGGPPILLLHGFPQTSWCWREVLAALGAAGYRAVALDQRGYCPRARPPAVSDYAIPHLVADVLAVADTMEMATFDLVGHDWGGMVAWVVGARHADRVGRLAVVSTPHPGALRAQVAGGDPHQASTAGSVELFRAVGTPERMLLGEDGSGAGLRRLFAATGMGEVPVDEYVACLTQPGAMTAALNWYRAMDAADVDGLPPVVVPTLYVWSTGDSALGRAAAEGTAEWVAGRYRFEVLQGVGHWVPELAGRELSRLLTDHLSGADHRDIRRASYRGVWKTGPMEQSTYSLSESQRDFRDTLRKFCEDRIAPHAAEADREARYPWASFEAMREMELPALWVPEAYGGTGADMVTQAVAAEEVSRVCASSGVTLLISKLGMLPVLNWGSEDLKARYLPPIARGEAQASYCLSEADAGSDVASMRTRAVRDGDDWVITGSKYWITNAGISDTYTVFARTDPDPASGHRGISCFLVEADWGVKVAKHEDKLGLRGSPTGEVTFDEVRVPASNMVGPEGKGFVIAMHTLDRSRPTIGAQAVGIAQGSMDAAAAYMKDRRAFGGPIADFQGLRFMLADMAMRTEAARTLVYRACSLVDDDPAGELTAVGAMAKCFAADTAMAVTTDAVQLFGGYGYTKDFPVERMMRDAKITQIYEGTNQIQRVVIAKGLLG